MEDWDQECNWYKATQWDQGWGEIGSPDGLMVSQSTTPNLNGRVAAIPVSSVIMGWQWPLSSDVNYSAILFGWKLIARCPQTRAVLCAVAQRSWLVNQLKSYRCLHAAESSLGCPGKSASGQDCSRRRRISSPFQFHYQLEKKKRKTETVPISIQNSCPPNGSQKAIRTTWLDQTKEGPARSASCTTWCPIRSSQEATQKGHKSSNPPATDDSQSDCFWPWRFQAAIKAKSHGQNCRPRPLTAKTTPSTSPLGTWSFYLIFYSILSYIHGHHLNTLLCLFWLPNWLRKTHEKGTRCFSQWWSTSSSLPPLSILVWEVHPLTYVRNSCQRTLLGEKKKGS